MPNQIQYKGVGVEFNAPLDTISVISEAVFTANHLTDRNDRRGTHTHAYIYIRIYVVPKIVRTNLTHTRTHTLCKQTQKKVKQNQ